MTKEELELNVLHSDLEDEVKLEIIRCIETAKPMEVVDWNSIPHSRRIGDFKETKKTVKDFNSGKLEIKY